MGILAELQNRILAQLHNRATRRRGSAVILAAALLALSLPSGAASPVEREYDQAVRSFRAGRVSEAFGRFVDLANHGDVDSARIALFMQGYGEVLYGKQWDAGPDNVAYWSMLVRNSGTSARPLPEYQPTVLSPSKARPRLPQARNAKPPAIASVARN
jgi:hypothetical protein